MLNQRIDLDYQLMFDASFHFGTGLRSGLIHRAVARDANGYLYVPGSTVKGVLRDRCGQIARLLGFPGDDPHAGQLREANRQRTIVEHIFGSRFQPGRLNFDDAQLVKEDEELFEPSYRDPDLRSRRRIEFRNWQTENRTQVMLWRPTNTAASGRLFTSEFGIRGLRFDGKISGWLTGLGTLTDPPVNYSLILLLAGLMSLDLIGGSKSRGAGQLVCEIATLSVDSETKDPALILDNLHELDFDLLNLIAAEEASL